VKERASSKDAIARAKRVIADGRPISWIYIPTRRAWARSPPASAHSIADLRSRKV